MDVERAIARIFLGGVSLLGSYLLHKVVPYMDQVPRFRDFSSLKDHVRNAPGQRAEVLVEGRVQKLADTSEYQCVMLASERTGLKGTARLVTTTKGTEADEGNRKTRNIPILEYADPFMLLDAHGSSIRVEVESVKETEGFRQLLQIVYEDKPELYSTASGQAPSRTVTREYLLLLGTSLAGYGEAVLQRHYLSSDSVLFTPTEVGSSIEDLHYPNKMKVSALKFVSVMLLVAGGTMIVLGITPLLVRILRRWCRHRPIPQLQLDQLQPDQRNQQQPDQRDEEDIY